MNKGCFSIYDKYQKVLIAKKFTESELLSLLRQKDENVVSHLYDTYAPMVYGLVLRELKNESISAEILKNAFIRISKECNNIDCTNRLFTWIWSLTQKTAQADFSISLQLGTLSNAKSLILKNHSSKNSFYSKEPGSSYPFLGYKPL